MIGPRSAMQLNAAVEERVPENEVREIRLGLSQRVYIWGKVFYEDVFEDSHCTEFCLNIYWIDGANGPRIYGNYDFYRNKAT